MRKDYFNPTDEERALEFISTSVDDLHCTLLNMCDPKDRHLVEAALVLAHERGFKTKIKLLAGWLMRHPEVKI